MRRNFTAPPSSWRLWQSGPRAPAICDAQDIYRACTLAHVAQAAAHGVRGNLARDPCGLERRRAKRQLRREGRGVRAARAVGGAVGVPRARDRHERRAIEEQIRRLLAMAAGDNDDLGSERVDAASELLPVDGC